MKHESSYGLKFVTLNESLIRSFRQATTSISEGELSHELVAGLHPAGVRTNRTEVAAQWLRLAIAASRSRSAQHRRRRSSPRPWSTADAPTSTSTEPGHVQRNSDIRAAEFGHRHWPPVRHSGSFEAVDGRSVCLVGVYPNQTSGDPPGNRQVRVIWTIY